MDGDALCARLPRILGEGLRMVTTRTAEKVEACERLGFHTVRPSSATRRRWLNLPPPAEVILTIITFALDGSSVEAYGDLWSNKLNQDAPVFCLGTSSAFGADKELDPAEPTVVPRLSSHRVGSERELSLHGAKGKAGLWPAGRPSCT